MPVPPDRARDRQCPGAVEDQDAVLFNVAPVPSVARTGAVADLQRAGADRRPAGVRIRAGERQRPIAELRQCARAADHPAKGHRVGAIEGQDAARGHVPHNAARCAPGADLQRARRDRRAARVGVGPGQDRRAGPDLQDVAAGAADDAAERHGVGPIERQLLAVGHVHVADDAASRARRCQSPAAVVDDRPAGIGIRPRENGRPGAVLVTAPVPLMSLATVSALLRLKFSVALLMTAPLPSVPVAPLPIWRMPALMVVVPCVAVGPGQNRRARRELGHRAGAADCARDRQCPGAVENEGAVVHRRAGPERARHRRRCQSAACRR